MKTELYFIEEAFNFTYLVGQHVRLWAKCPSPTEKAAEGRSGGEVFAEVTSI